MGNRAVLCFDEYNDEAIGIYLHYYGGRESIEAFLQAAREVMGDRLGDEAYARARLSMCIGIAIPGNLSFGLGKCEELDCDNNDNGTYIIDSATLTIKGRMFFEGTEQDEYNTYDINESVESIINSIKAADSVE